MPTATATTGGARLLTGANLTAFHSRAWSLSDILSFATSSLFSAMDLSDGLAGDLAKLGGARVFHSRDRLESDPLSDPQGALCRASCRQSQH